MAIKIWLGIITTLILMAACSQRTYNIEELKGTYKEVKTENSKWSDNCILNVGDSTLTLKNCRLLKDFTANKIRVVEDRLLYYFPEYYTSFDIFEKEGQIHLIQHVEDKEDITFKKVD